MMTMTKTTAATTTRTRVQGFCSSKDEVSVLLECDIASMDILFLTFQDSIMVSSARVIGYRNPHDL
jgi:hypothetical protein